MESSRLGALPAELRIRIYEYILAQQTRIDVTRTMGLWGQASIWKSPALLQTCRQLRSEASDIYYGENTFYGTHLVYDQFDRTLCHWLRALAPQNRSSIRRIVFYDRTGREAVNVAGRIAKLRRLLKSFEGFAACDVEIVFESRLSRSRIT